MSEIAIRIEHLSKRYNLGIINSGTFFRDMQSFIARKLGKPDPNAKLGFEFSGGPNTFWALKDVTFDIKQGDRIGIIGRNGAGKSTLLKLISRISAPTEGSIKIKGRVTSLLEVGTGFHKELTGRENIYLNGSILGMKKRQIDRKIDEIIDFSGIERHIDTPAKRYSSGMYVRLAFAVAAHLDSEILIADEVLAVGDAEFQKKALGKMNDISSQQGRTVLFVSHNMGAVTSLCKNGVILEKGRLVFQGTIQDCVSRYTDKIDVKTTRWEGSVGDGNLRFLFAEVVSQSERIILSFTIETFVPSIDYDFTLDFFNVDGKMVATADLTDWLTSEQYKQLTSKGVHEVSIPIDASIFTSGVYAIQFDFAIYGIKRIVPSEITVSFEVFTPLFVMHPHGLSKNNICPKFGKIEIS